MLSILSVAWNAGAGTAAVVTGLIVGSLALAGFGLDAAIDAAASLVLIRRFYIEGRDPARAEVLERRAARVVGIALLVIAAYLATQAVRALFSHSGPEGSAVGLFISAASVIALPPLAYAKYRTAVRLASRALRGDSVLTGMAAILAAASLLSLVLVRLLNWWWADAVAALIVAVVLARESYTVLVNLRKAR
ncbi:MAG: cation transporter [Candidatus Dormibacteraeota bacterium]|nr:cation transporter [Candidatus Dormibacteraeota bacterium]